MSDAEDKREVFMSVVGSFLNTFYTWGGDDPSGFDCSGMVVAGLKAVGLMGGGEDLTADKLYNRFKGKYPSMDWPAYGRLVFYFNDEGHATHVAVCIDAERCITAAGGGKHIRSREDAIRHNAFIKIRPIEYHSRSMARRVVELFGV